MLTAAIAAVSTRRIRCPSPARTDAARSHRAGFLRAPSASPRVIVRDDRNGATREHPSSVAFSRMKSILSALGSPTRSVTVTSGGGSCGHVSRTSARSDREVASRIRIRYRLPAPSKAKNEAPGPRRSARSICPASVPDKTAVSPEMFPRLTKNVGILRRGPFPPEKKGGPLAILFFPCEPAPGGLVLFFHPVALFRQDPGKNQPASPLHPGGDFLLEIDEDLREDVRQDEIVSSLHARKRRRGGIEPVLHAVDPGIFPGDLNRLRVDVDPHCARRPQACRGNPEDPRAGPEIQHPEGQRGGVEGLFQKLEAHPRRLVRPGAECLAGVDGEAAPSGEGRLRLPRRRPGESASR